MRATRGSRPDGLWSFEAASMLWSDPDPPGRTPLLCKPCFNGNHWHWPYEQDGTCPDSRCWCSWRPRNPAEWVPIRNMERRDG